MSKTSLDFHITEIELTHQIRSKQNIPSPSFSFHDGGAHRFAEVSRGDVPALFVLRVAAASTSVDGHTRRFIENVGGSPELPAHVHTHLPGDALSPPPLRLDTCRRHDNTTTYTITDLVTQESVFTFIIIMTMCYYVIIII